MKVIDKMQLYRLIYNSQSALHVRAMFSTIIGRTWLYLQHLAVFTNVVAGWCHGWVRTHPLVSSNSSMIPAGSDIGEYYQML